MTALANASGEIAMEPSEPTFEKRMSFGDHLEELRSRILRSAIGIVWLRPQSG